MKIQVTISPSQVHQRRLVFDLDDFDISEQDWAMMSKQEQASAICEMVDGLDQPYWVVDDFNEQEIA